MPKLVSELAQGNQFGRSSDGGNLADTAVRVWKVILNSANEPLDIFAAIGVQIGDPYSSSNQVPCVSIEGRADGESRLVRIITATYKTTAGDGGAGEDPKLVMPELRPANFSTSTTLYEEAASRWFENPDEDKKTPAVNPVGDLLDGLTRLTPITTIRVTQFEASPGTVWNTWVGDINEEEMNFGSYATFGKHTVMFRGVEAQPHVETFGTVTYRGFMNSYEFAYKQNGWNLDIPLSGFNCKAFNPAAPTAEQDPYALPLKRDGEYGPLVQPLALQDGVAVGDKVRAMVRVAGSGKDALQSPSAQPIPLNVDGTPRSENADPKVLIRERRIQDDKNLTQLLQLRLG